MLGINKHPIDNIKWININQLKANDYNPNIVFNQELKLLKFSILQNGWIQPILVTQNYIIIDGFHRYHLTRDDKEVYEFTNGKVPIIIMELSEPERMLLTIRINRAKGSHIAIKLSDIIKKLVKDYQYSIKQISENIGATKKEIDVLMMNDIFEAFDIKNHKYSKAWYPKK